jgi:membrane associated rhomboid family serine protease
MHLDMPEDPPDSPAQRKADQRRLLGAFNASLGFVLVLCAMFAAQHVFDWQALAVAPLTLAGLAGIATAPLLHGSPEHLIANGIAMLMLGTLALGVYPKATLRALPLLWIGSGLGAWLLGEAGSRHLGASGLTHGLMFLVFVLGVLRRDRPAIAAAMLAFLFYGGMLLTVLPREPGVSWQAHLGGALAGVLAAWLLRNADPKAARRRYSWEIEEDLARDAAEAEHATYELPRPGDVPVLWRRDAAADDARGVVLPFRAADGRAGSQREPHGEDR